MKPTDQVAFDRKQQWTRWLRRLGLTAAIYFAIALLANTAAGGLMYQPQYGSFREVEGMRKIRAPDGGMLAVIYLPNPKARLTLWYFHGNAEDLGNVEPLLRKLHDAGFAVFAFDYPGYGLSDGHPSEKSIYAAARTARTYLREVLKVPANRTLLYGRSLGSGPAVQMATEERAAGLVLQSAFTSAYRVITHWHLLPFDQFENLNKLPHVHCPVLVMHGREDHVIPFYHGEALYAAAAEPKRRLWVDFAGHNDFLYWAGDAYWQALRDFSALCTL